VVLLNLLLKYPYIGIYHLIELNENMVKQMEGHSTSDILQSISDLLSADLFYSIAKAKQKLIHLSEERDLP
jgi:hypothetical protein